MPTRTIVCINCGIDGEIEVAGLNGDVSPAKLFKHLWHNPFPGHMHFQYPAYKIVLLVDPLAVLSDETAPFSPGCRLKKRPGKEGISLTCLGGDPHFKEFSSTKTNQQSRS
jgi:hypothetical protein